MKSKVYLWEDGTFEIEEDYESDNMEDQIMCCSVGSSGTKIRHGIWKTCAESKTQAVKKELAKYIVNECDATIKAATKRRKKFEKVLKSLQATK